MPGSLYQFGFKQTLGNDYQHLNQVIQRIYNKMFMPASTESNAPKKTDRVTQSLLFKILENALSYLQGSVNEVQKNTSHLPLPKMTEIPSIVACL